MFATSGATDCAVSLRASYLFALQKAALHTYPPGSHVLCSPQACANGKYKGDAMAPTDACADCAAGSETVDSGGSFVASVRSFAFLPLPLSDGLIPSHSLFNRHGITIARGTLRLRYNHRP